MINCVMLKSSHTHMRLLAIPAVTAWIGRKRHILFLYGNARGLVENKATWLMSFFLI